MACNYLWTLRWFFAEKYLLVSQWSVGVLSLLSLKLQVFFIIVNGAYLNAKEVFLSFLLDSKNDCFSYLKSRLNKETGNCCFITCLVETCCVATKQISREQSFFDLVRQANSQLDNSSQLRYHLLQPFLPDVGVNLGGRNALVAQQRLDVHPFGPGVKQVGGVGVAQLVR